MAEVADNIYPHSSEYFGIGTQPEGQKEEKSKSIQDTLSELPLLNEIVDHLTETIDKLNSVHSVDMSAETDAVTFQKQILINKGIVEKLTIEREFIMQRVKQTRG